MIDILVYTPPSPSEQMLLEQAILEYLRKEGSKTLNDLNQHLFSQWDIFLDPHDTAGNGKKIGQAVSFLQEKGSIHISEVSSDGTQEVSATEDPAKQSTQQGD